MSENRGILDPNARTAAAKFEQTMRQVESELREVNQDDDLVRALVLSQGAALARQLFTPAMIKMVRQVEGSPLGYLVDKKNYSDDEIRDALIEGRLRGFRFTGGEMMVIAGRFYACQNGLARVVQSHPAVADLTMTPGRPMFAKNPDGSLDQKTKCVGYRAEFMFNRTWRDHEVADDWKHVELVYDIVRDEQGRPIRDERIPIRVNAGQSDDAVLGKAKRKMLQRLYEYVTAERLHVADEDDVKSGDVEDAEYTVTQPAEPAKEEPKEDETPFD